MFARLVSAFNFRSLEQLVFVLICLSLFAVSVFGGGLDWGDEGDGNTEDASCIPDNPLVIQPGPLGTPLRITPFDDQNFLVADYSRNKLYWFSDDGTLSLFIETKGKPLSVAINATFKQNGKLREAYYFVGNDSARTIDVYYEDKKGVLNMQGQYPVDDDGIQALDMVYDQQEDVLYVVDGLDRDIKVVQPSGDLLNTFSVQDPSVFYPKGIAFDPENKKLYVSDYNNPAVGKGYIWIFDTLNNPPTPESFIQSGGSVNFSRPQGVAVAQGKLYFVDNILAQVLEYDLEPTTFTSRHSCKGSSDGHLLLPMDVAVAKSGQKLYVADSRNMRISVIPLEQP